MQQPGGGSKAASRQVTVLGLWTYLTELRGFGDVAFEAVEQTTIMGKEGAIAASTATTRARNAVGATAGGRHACRCCCATAGLPGRAAAAAVGRLCLFLGR